MLELAAAIAAGAFAVVYGVMRLIKLYIDIHNNWPKRKRKRRRKRVPA